MTLAQNLLLFNASDDLRLAFGSHEHLPISKSEVQNVQALGMGSEPRESADLVRRVRMNADTICPQTYRAPETE